MELLWLASWYPNKTNPFNGDFIQRHAAAVSGHSRVTVIHVVRDPDDLAASPLETVVTQNLTEHIYYYRPSRIPFLSQLRAFLLYVRAIKKYIKTQGAPTFIHVHVCMNAGLPALWAGKRWKIPYLVTEHFTGYIPGSDGNYYQRSFLYRLLNKRILQNAEGVHCVSAYLRACIENIAPIRHPIVIPNVVDVTVFEPGPGFMGPFRFIHVSSFEPFKNVRQLLDAFVLLAGDWELVLVGPAPEDIRAYADTLAIAGRLRWTGSLPYTEVAARMKASDCLVQFSRYETQGCVILEAMATGSPVVSSAVGGVPEIVGAGDGVLVPAGDIQALAGALERVKTDYETYDRAQIAARAARKYGYDTVGRAFADYYALLDGTDR